MRQIPSSIFGRAVSTIPKEEPSVQEEIKEEVSIEEVEEVKSEAEDVKAEEVKIEEVVEEPVEESEEEIKTEEVETIEPEQTSESEKEEEVKAEEPTQEEAPKKRRTRKTAVATVAEDAPPVVNASMKMTGTSKLPDAVALVVPEYEDPTFTEFMEHMNEALLHTVFDERADAGVIKVVLSNLARCYDNATRKYAEVSSKLETISNKSFGLIVRQTAANSLGTNDAERKRNGLHAPEVYKGTGSKTLNLFAIEAGLRKQALELQMIIKQIEFKKSAIIGYLTASKQDADV